MPRQDVTAVVNTAVMLTVAAALSLCVAGILNNERDCGVVVTSCERTQGCSRAVVRTPPAGCGRCAALIRLQAPSG